MNVTIAEIEKYLSEVKKSIITGKFKVEMNDLRQNNRDLFFDYVINEEQRKQILLNLTPYDFSEILPNEHKGYEYERLYVFGKEVKLLEKFGSKEVTVPLYIKFNKLSYGYVVVISFHKQRYSLSYMFK